MSSVASPSRRFPISSVNGHTNGHITSRKARRFTAPRADRVLYLGAAATPWALAIILLAVSMPHLAHGFASITQCGALAGWLLAIAIDLTQVTAKLQLTVAKRYVVGSAAIWTAAAIVGATSTMSMALNVLAFLSGATTFTGVVLAWVTGILLPLLILGLSFTGSCFAVAKVRTPAVKAKR